MQHKQGGSMVHTLTFEQIGHEPLDSGFHALSPDYEAADIGNFTNLYATVLGYQIDAIAAMNMINFLSAFVIDSTESIRLFSEKKGQKNGI